MQRERREQHDPRDALAAVQRVICTGEPGPSIPTVRHRIQIGWGALPRPRPAVRGRPFGYPCDVPGGLHLIREMNVFPSAVEEG